MQLLPGGSVKPIEDTDIQLVWKKIEIILYPDYYETRVSYIFLNHSAGKNVIMGFPTHKGEDWNSASGVREFKAYYQGQLMETFVKKASFDSKFTGVLIDAFECFQITVKDNERFEIQNVFKQDYQNYYEGFGSGLGYILETGRFWKGNIEKIEVTVDASQAGGGRRLWHENSNKQWIHESFVNVDPDFNLHYFLIEELTFEPIKASSELPSSAKNLYTSSNLMDGLAATAWVEGVEGYGIGEVVHFETVLIGRPGFLRPLKLDSIMIINGYGKSDYIFQINSRPKLVEISFKVKGGSWDESEQDYGWNESRTRKQTFMLNPELSLENLLRP